MVDRIQIINAPSQAAWYFSQIGKKFDVLFEYDVHYEVDPNSKNWPEDVALLVRTEDCKVVSTRGYKHVRQTGNSRHVSYPFHHNSFGVPVASPEIVKMMSKHGARRDFPGREEMVESVTQQLYRGGGYYDRETP